MTSLGILTGRKILEEVESPINGKLTVIRDLAWGTHIQDENGLTQSGGVAEKIWKTPLKKIKKQKINNCLILGLGGGGIAKIVRKNWSDSIIVGVDIDPVIVNLGKKYLDLERLDVDVHIEDASEFLKSQISQNKTKYDLVCIDMYVKDNVPEKFKSTKFIKDIKKLLSIEGISVFNRLYHGRKTSEAEKFKDKLAEVFDDVAIIYPEANVMFMCRNG